MKKVFHAVIQSGNGKMETWLDADSRVKVGTKIKLKDYEPEKWWEVMYRGEDTELPLSAKTRSEKFHEHDDHRRHEGLKISGIN